MALRCYLVPDFEDKGELFEFIDDIWGHKDWELRSESKYGLCLVPNDDALKFFERREGFVSDIKIAIGSGKVRQWLCGSINKFRDLYVIAISIYRDAALCDVINI